MDKPKLTEEAGYEALKCHVVEKALLARSRYGPVIGREAIEQILVDPEIVRFHTTLKFDVNELMMGEFAWAKAVGEKPSDGFTLFVHPHFEGRWDVLPLLIAYHVVSINYLDVATQDEAEIFGAALLGMEVLDYYDQLCDLADSIPGAEPYQEPPTMAQVTAAVGGCGSGSCGC